MNLRKIFHIKPDEQAELIQPVLSLHIGEKHFSFAISNARADQLYHLASFSADEITPDVLAEILSQHPEASAAFYKTSVCFSYPAHILVPDEYYSNESISELWSEVHGLPAGKNIISEPVLSAVHQTGQLNDIYSVPGDMQQFLMRRYPTAAFKNFPALALKSAGHSENGLLQIDIGVDEFELVAVSANQLLLTERFEYSVPHDVVYQLLKVCNAYSLSQYKVQLKLSGLVDKDSALFKELYQYFMQIEFRNAAWAHTDYPAHYFTLLNDIARCAS